MTDEEKKLDEAIKRDGVETQSEILEELKRRYPQYAEQSPTEQEIKRMANIICPNGVYYSADYTAQMLHNAGIGDKKQAIKEAFEKLKENAETMIYEVGALPHGDERYKFSYEAVTVRQIDELFTELYGADE